MELPEGWKRISLKCVKDAKWESEAPGLNRVASFDHQWSGEIHIAMCLMKEMAEALDRLAIIYYSKEEGLNKTEHLRKEPVLSAIEVLKKWRDWK